MAFCARSANSSGTLSGGINASLFTFPFFHSRITKCYKILILARVVQVASYPPMKTQISIEALYNHKRVTVLKRATIRVADTTEVRGEDHEK